MNDSFGQEAVRAWLVIAAIFVSLSVLGLLAEWDGLTRSAIIASSISLFAGLAAIAGTVMRVVRR